MTNTPHTPTHSERDALINERASLLAQRDELREALKVLHEAVSDNSWPNGGSADAWLAFKGADAIARAALAKANP